MSSCLEKDEERAGQTLEGKNCTNRACMCACVCVRVGERERERERVGDIHFSNLTFFEVHMLQL